MAVGVSVIGCGHMGRHHARVAAMNPQTKLLAVYDVLQERAQSVAAQHNCRVDTDISADCKLVIIATPATSHQDWIRRARAKGCFVLVEKPVVASVSELKGLDGEDLMVGFSERFNPLLRGVHGRSPFSMVSQRTHPWVGRCADVDVVRDLMVHDLDLFCWWSDAIPTVRRARGTIGKSGMFDAAEVTLALPTGESAYFFADRQCTTTRRTLSMHGPSGNIELDLLRDAQSNANIRQTDALCSQLEAALRHMSGHKSRIALWKDGVRTVELAEQIIQVAHEGYP